MLRTWSEAGALLVFQGLLRLFPLSLVHVPGAALGWVLFHVFRVGRGATLRNLTFAFGDRLSPARRRRLAGAVYRFFGGMICEVLAIPRLSLADLQQRVTLDNPDVLRDAQAGGRGVVLVSGHLGNWELMGAVLSRSGMGLSMYVGAQRNPFVDNVLNRIRRSQGTETIGRGVAMRGLLRALRGGGIVAMLADQHYSRKRHYVTCFGRPVSMVPGPASLAQRAGAPVIFGICVRTARFRYRVRFTPIAPPPPSGDAERDLLALSQAISDALEQAMREHPEQYFWMHRRWRPIPQRVELSEVNRAFLEAQGIDVAAHTAEGGRALQPSQQ
jgi:KDO2-lipid IV(A) lauroyltransferase